MSRPPALFLANPKAWEDMTRTHMPQVSNVAVVTKDNATQKGAPGIAIGFEVLIGTNKIPVHFTMPLEAFMGMCEVIKSHHNRTQQ